MEKPPNPGRRLFLGSIAAGALATTGLLKYGSRLEQLSGVQKEPSPRTSEQETPVKPDEEVTATPEQGLLQQTDDDVIAETLSQQLEHSDHVTIDKKTIEAIYQKWHREYSPGGARHEDMLNGLERMQPWLEDIQHAFRENNLPEEFAYLSVAESHFQLHARSRSGAKGPYQFMEKTARKHPANLTITPAYDERIDPIKSASACAKLLADNYKNFGGDPQTTLRYDKANGALYLAISGYNGTYPWRYAKVTPKQARSTGDYLSFVETQINNIIATAIKKHSSQKHTARPKETIAAIAKRYAITTETLMQANGLKDPALKANQKLRIPLSEKNRIAMIRHALRNHNENINYPAKLYAIIDVIKALGLETKFATGKKLNFAEIPIKQDQRITLVHTVAQKETLYFLARKYSKHLGVTEAALRQTIMTENKLGSTGALTIGQKITIGASSQAPTLEKIARDNNTSTDVLRAYNPAVLSPGNPLPPGVKMVRIPKKSMLAERP
ncbi:MAG: lytic transglycosylase [Patescibacteria group bacterium]|mgnify:CR=1 FL=1